MGTMREQICQIAVKCIYIFYRTDLTLPEYDFTLNFCRVVIEKFGFNVRLRYGRHTVQKQVH